MSNRNESIGIYIHIPFCKSKCYYCDFNSYAGRDYLAGSYFDALYKEILIRSRSLENRRVSSIFIGGGTPSLTEPQYITGLIEICGKCFHVDNDAEISMESNPGTLSYDRLKAYRDAGVNRLSIGLQTWQDQLLESIGRIHSRKQFVDNVEDAVKCGFENINADLIFGLPGQTLEDWTETLEAVTGLGAIKHLSCYSLKIEEGTVFGDRLDAGLLEPIDEELDRRMYHLAVDVLADKGYRWYEISNFAVPGYECRHNLLYWKAREYVGFGAGAHSHLDAVRFSNVAGIEEYIEAVGSIFVRQGCEGTGNEFLMEENCSESNHDNAGAKASYSESNHDNVAAKASYSESDHDNVAAKASYSKSDHDYTGEGSYSISDHNDTVAKASAKASASVSGKVFAEESATVSAKASVKPSVSDGMAGLYENIELIDREGAMSEYMILGLRLTEGVSSKEFEERFGEKPEDIYGDELKKLTARGLLTAEPGGKCRCDSDTRYKLTRLGFDLANAVFVEFI